MVLNLHGYTSNALQQEAYSEMNAVADVERFVVVYPDGVWYGHVTAPDVAEIVERHLVGGEPVERLRLAEGCINTGACAHKPRRTAGG